MTWKKTDSNQQEIVEALRKCGFSVAVTSSLGKGFPDIICGKSGKNLLVEIKDGNKPPSARKLSDDEQKFFNEWRGHIIVANNLEDILKCF